MPINNKTIQYSKLFEKPVKVSRELFLQSNDIDSSESFVTYKYLTTGISSITFRLQGKHSVSIEGALDPEVSKYLIIG